MKDFNRCSSHGHCGSKRHELVQAQHTHVDRIHSLTHQHQCSCNHIVWSVSSAITEFGIKFLFWRYHTHTPLLYLGYMNPGIFSLHHAHTLHCSTWGIWILAFLLSIKHTHTYSTALSWVKYMNLNACILNKTFLVLVHPTHHWCLGFTTLKSTKSQLLHKTVFLSLSITCSLNMSLMAFRINVKCFTSTIFAA